MSIISLQNGRGGAGWWLVQEVPNKVTTLLASATIKPLAAFDYCQQNGVENLTYLVLSTRVAHSATDPDHIREYVRTFSCRPDSYAAYQSTNFPAIQIAVEHNTTVAVVLYL